MYVETTDDCVAPLIMTRLKSQTFVLEANGHEEMLTWLQELQDRRREYMAKLRQTYVCNSSTHATGER